MVTRALSCRELDPRGCCAQQCLECTASALVVWRTLGWLRPPAKLCVTPRSAPAHLGSQAQDGVISLVQGDAQLILHQLAACGANGHRRPERHER